MVVITSGKNSLAFHRPGSWGWEEGIGLGKRSYQDGNNGPSHAAFSKTELSFWMVPQRWISGSLSLRAAWMPEGQTPRWGEYPRRDYLGKLWAASTPLPLPARTASTQTLTDMISTSRVAVSYWLSSPELSLGGIHAAALTLPSTSPATMKSRGLKYNGKKERGIKRIPHAPDF